MQIDSEDKGKQGGFTLLEIIATVVVLGILATLCFPVVKGFRARAEGLKCASHLKGLGLGVQAYITDYRRWPQIAPEKRGGLQSSALSDSAQAFAEKWIAALAPYGVDEATWRCPTVENQMKRQGKKEALQKKRIDYIPTTFDANPDSPTKWPRHPWFVERGSLHGTGPNILFGDGSVSNVNELFNSAR
jgi:prepilin-type N-terminal cleavage/methylation domain-containing protein/prepilin-type processing-associated H-X9-DG protein